MRRILLAVLSLAVALGSSAVCVAQAPVYKLLYSAPNPGSQGARPETVLEAAPGLFYFLSGAQGSVAGGPSFGPSIFSLTGGGSSRLVYSFPFDRISYALVQAADARLYGAVFVSLQGSFYYSVSVSGQDPQQYPAGKWGSLFELAAAPEGLYDAVAASNSHGVLTSVGFARIDEKGAVTILHQAPASDGIPTGSRLVLAADGNIYGVGSQSTELTPPMFIFRLTPSGAYARLLTFPSAVYPGPYGPSLIAASDGNLYGTFSGGGANNTGIIFQATLSGQWQTMASFPASGSQNAMINPNSLMEASDGGLYGSTVHDAIFRYDLTTHALTLAYQMNKSNLQGACAPCNFIQGSDGKLYGTAATGGPGGGAVFSLDFGLPKPAPFVNRIIPATGSAGQSILLWGGHLVGATSVSFNGVAGAFQVNSTQAVMATVPPGATSGLVTITTANGSFTTTQDFTVQ
jgi:uncharacterized repeat protein (TIGR03803 family)